MPAVIQVEGIRELNRAFAKVSNATKRGMQAELAKAAEPARTRAEELAVANISNIGPVWSRVRLGVTSRGVYIAPRARRRGGSPRPNLGGLLLHQALEPAAKEKEPEIHRAIEDWLDRLEDQSGF